MRVTVCCSSLLVLTAIAVTTLGTTGLSWGSDRLPPSLLEPVQSLADVDLAAFPGIDLDSVMAEDAAHYEEGLAPRFALAMPTSLTPEGRGTWETLRDGSRLWRLRIASAEALSLNLGFTRFHLPPTAELWLYSPDYTQLLGPFTDRDNDAHRQLWTPVILGEEVVVELSLERSFLPYLEVEIGSVNHGYTGFGYPDSTNSDSCNLDVICGAADGWPQVDPWRDQIRSVAAISVGGSTHCSGFLVNNVAQDLRGYFQTAYHCGVTPGTAPSLVAYWNYENSWCRQPFSPESGEPGDGSLAQFNTGSSFRAGFSASDFTLVELDDPPLAAARPYWAGWNNASGDFPSAVGIHHPNSQEKRISFEYDPTSTSSYAGATEPGDGTHLRINGFDVGRPQTGSSGSPAFDPNKRVVGQLHGGCHPVWWYGRASASWLGGGTAATQLKAWLDPAATGTTTLDGRNGCAQPSFDFTISPNPAVAGQVVTFDAVNVTGTGPYLYAWDLDGDTVVDCTTDPCLHTYAAYYNGDVTLTVTDQGVPCDATLTRAVVVNGPSVTYRFTGAPAELCGDGDQVVEPGEEWSVPVTVANGGNAAASATRASVTVAGAPATVTMTTGTLDFGIVAAGAQQTAAFSFLVASAFAPCGALIQFDLGPVTWAGGSNPGTEDVYTAATGGYAGTQGAFVDGFEDVATWGGLDYPGSDKWAVTTGPGPHTAGEWERVNQQSARPTGSTGYFALSDSDRAGSGSATSTILTSPVINLSAVASGPVTLEYDLYYNDFTDPEFLDVQVWDGSAWQTVAHFAGADVNAHQSHDVSAQALGNAGFRVRFSYQDASYCYWSAVDAVQVVVPAMPACDNTVLCNGETPLFADGFESGDAGAWDAAPP